MAQYSIARGAAVIDHTVNVATKRERERERERCVLRILLYAHVIPILFPRMVRNAPVAL